MTDHEQPSAGQVSIATAMLIMTPLFWAGHSVVGRIIANEIPTFTLVSMRWLMAFAILMVFIAPKVWAERWLLIKHWRYVLLTGLIGPALFPCLLYTGLKTTTVTNTSIIQTSVPGLVPFIAWLLLKERVALQQVIGIGISSIGVALIATQGNLLAIAEVEFVPGDLVILCAFTAWAIYTVVIRLKPRQMHANTLLASSMAIGGLATLPLWLWELSEGKTFPVTEQSMWAFGYIMLFPTLLAYFFYNHAINIVGPTKAGLASHLVPPLGICLGVIFLGENFEIFHAVSFAAILSGVVLVIRGGHASGKPKPA
ncbi:DMT family transporter [Thalassospiraceae bacterium LMO-JJ14]|nr:DMT family transporter [Thalassospiraceae bacterium LMO-JJ14]